VLGRVRVVVEDVAGGHVRSRLLTMVRSTLLTTEGSALLTSIRSLASDVELTIRAHGAASATALLGEIRIQRQPSYGHFMTRLKKWTVTMALESFCQAEANTIALGRS
jgi:hypothetical protein